MKTSFPDVEPHLCTPVPLAIDLARVPSPTNPQPTSPLNLVEFYGFDFDRTKVDAVLVEIGGTRDVSFALAWPTHYHLTLNLGANGVRLTPASQMVGLKWNSAIQSTVSVIQPTTPICQSRVDAVPAGKQITLRPRRVGGDGNFAGHGPDVSATVQLLKRGDTRVDAEVFMTA